MLALVLAAIVATCNPVEDAATFSDGYDQCVSHYGFETGMQFEDCINNVAQKFYGQHALIYWRA